MRPGMLPLAAEAAALPAGPVGALGGAQTAVADARGRFALDGLLPGRYRLEVARDGYQPMALEATLGPGERRDVGTVTLAEGFPVRGRVVDQIGAPIEGARVGVHRRGAAGLPGGVTDAAGQFALALAPGRYRVTASAEGWGTASADTTAESGGAQPIMELRLARADGTIEGLVRDDAGRPLVHARLAARPARTGSPSNDATAAPPVATATTDAGGHFRLARVPAGELRVEVAHPDYPWMERACHGRSLCDDCRPWTFWAVSLARVRARATGALGAARARRSVVGLDGATATAKTKGTGTFRLLNLSRPARGASARPRPSMRPAEQQVDVPWSLALGEPSVPQSADSPDTARSAGAAAAGDGQQRDQGRQTGGLSRGEFSGGAARAPVLGKVGCAGRGCDGGGIHSRKRRAHRPVGHRPRPQRLLREHVPHDRRFLRTAVPRCTSGWGYLGVVASGQGPGFHARVITGVRQPEESDRTRGLRWLSGYLMRVSLVGALVFYTPHGEISRPGTAFTSMSASKIRPDGSVLRDVTAIASP